MLIRSCVAIIAVLGLCLLAQGASAAEKVAGKAGAATTNMRVQLPKRLPHGLALRNGQLIVQPGFSVAPGGSGGVAMIRNNEDGAGTATVNCSPPSCCTPSTETKPDGSVSVYCKSSSNCSCATTVGLPLPKATIMQ